MAVVKTISTDQFAFHNCNVILDGVRDSTVTLNGVTYSEAMERNEIYGTGNKPISIGEGNRTYSGNFVVLQSDLESLLENGLKDGYFNIVVEYQKTDDGPVIVDTIERCKILSIEKGINQGDEFSEHTVEFKALNIKFGSEG